MNTTPNANKLTVCIFGRCNAGKSSLFNALTGTDTALTSPLPGTTTDPVTKSMELIGHGPVVLIDTAGLGDESELGSARMEKARRMLDRADLAIYAVDAADPGEETLAAYQEEFRRRNIPCLTVYTKSDLVGAKDSGNTHLRVSIHDRDSVAALQAVLVEELNKLDARKKGLLDGLLPQPGPVILVIPIDSEAPEGRLILPQVQLIRACLDRNIRCHVTTVETLAEAVRDLPHAALVITDSQAFHEVAEILPPQMPLTSFSILMARQKGDIGAFIEGISAVERLKDGDKVLIAETCAHTNNHEDIGQVKIPAMLRRKTGKELDFHFSSGRDYPADLEKYSLVVHCGGCMITKKEMENRVRIAKEKEVPITNYGVLLAWGNGILERSTAMLSPNELGKDLAL